MADLLRRPVHFGIAIAPDRVVAVSDDSAQEDAWTQDLGAPLVTGEWPDLVTALERFRGSVGNTSAVASIALMPGLVQVRPIDLPFLRKGELLSVLQREAARFFLGARGDQVVAIRHVHRTRGRRVVLAAAAPRWLIELLASQLATNALRLHKIVPAHEAWALAARASRLSQGWLGVAWGDVLELLELRRGDVRQVRRVRAVGDEAMVREITGISQASVAIVTKHDSAMTVAARYAGRARSLALVAPSVSEVQLRRGWQQTRWLLSAASLLLVLSGMLRLVDLDRELAHSRAVRQGMERDVASALDVQTTVSGIERLVAQLCEIRERSPRWSDAIVTVATNLPLDTHLVRLSASGDSVTLEGATKGAATVLEQLRAAPGVMAIHASAPIRMDTNAGEVPTEYFTVVVRLAPGAERARQQ